MNPAVLRLLNQQLASPESGKPEEAVAHLGALQAQEYRLMRWAVGMRTRRPSASAFKRAYDEGRIVRLHLMRGTWQLVAAEDYRAFLGLCAPRARAVTEGWMHGNGIDISEEERRLVRRIMARTAEKKGSATKEDFAAALVEKGMGMDDHRLSYHIRMGEFSGVLCNGELRPMKATYALAEAKMAGAGRAVGRDEALARFARKYFQSRQPATMEDFVWWSGLGAGECRRGIEMLGGWLCRERWGGREFFLTEDCRTRGFRRGRVLLVPPYDEYLIGYKSREVALPPEHRHRAHNNSGIFRPIIVVDGVVCGNWIPFGRECGAEFFGEEGREEDVRVAWEGYMRFWKR